MKENNDKNHASNLIYQLGLKKCYSKIKKSALEVEQCYSQFEEYFKEDIQIKLSTLIYFLFNQTRKKMNLQNCTKF